MSDIQKYQTHEIVHANNAVKLTNKLLAIANVELIPYRKGNKWGFCTPNKRIVINCIYEEVTLYDNELAAVKLNNKWGFINKLGCVVIECIYEEVTLFYEEIVAVKLNDNWGFINKQGFVVIEFIYYGVERERFIDGLLVVTKAIWQNGVIDMKGNLIVPCIYDRVIILEGLIYVTKNHDYYDGSCDYGYLDRLGNLLTPQFFDHYPDTNTINIYTELTYSTADNMRIVSDGYINKEGNFLDTLKYQCHKKFFNGLAAIQFNDKWGFINTNGDVVIDFIYDETDNFYGENTFVLRNGTYRLINHSGQEVFRFNDHIKISSAEYGYFILEETHRSQYGVDKKYGILDNNGNIVVKAIYDEKFFFQDGCTETYKRKQNEKGLIHLKDLSYCKTTKYKYVRLQDGQAIWSPRHSWDKYLLRDPFGIPIPSGLFVVELDEKYGIIEASGNEIVPCIYDLIYCFNSNYFRVEIDKKCGLIDDSGNLIIPCLYNQLYFFHNAFANGISQKLAKVHLNGKVGFVGMDGTEYWED